MKVRTIVTRRHLLLLALVTPAVGLLWACNADSISGEEGAADERVGVSSAAISGLISGAIEIDVSADLDPATGTPLNAGATLDWKKDALDNQGTTCLADGVTASCNQANVTAATGGVGHWNGVRIVDGFKRDPNIFLSGGKENDTSTWKIGPGSAGGPKYDISQAYIANNTTNLFFGMERLGNDGTTAFDFEFNSAAPSPNDPLVPTRTAGDVLFTFEMQGSSGSGSATPYIFIWDGSAYVQQNSPPAGTYSSINANDTTPAGPWGYVTDKGQWALGNLPIFTFAEATVPFGGSGVTLPGVTSCGGSAFVQVRTRSSSTDKSDLKDTTKIFRYEFGSLSASATKDSAGANGDKVTLSASALDTGATCTTCTFEWFYGKTSGGTTTWTSFGTGATIDFTFSATNIDSTNAITDETILGDSYTGIQRVAKIRAVATTSGCTATTNVLTVKQLILADP